MKLITKTTLLAAPIVFNSAAVKLSELGDPIIVLIVVLVEGEVVVTK